MSILDMLVLGLSILFGFLATTFMSIAVATDYWEHTDWNGDMLMTADNINKNESVFSKENNFYKLVLADPNSDNQTYQTFYIRSLYGGIWKICDYVTDDFKKTETYRRALEETSYVKYQCFNYMNEYKDRKDELDRRTGVWLVRMQNSASSCMIVALMCLLTAAITGCYGLVTKQVSACMVTGVMYIVGSVFVCFGLVIIHTKLDYLKGICDTLDNYGEKLPDSICAAKSIGVGWSVPIAWIAFAFLLIAFSAWLLLSRILRLERAKSML